MAPVDIVYFTVALFLALAALINWKRRRAVVAARLNRGLRGYVDTRQVDTKVEKKSAEIAAVDKNQEGLIPA